MIVQSILKAKVDAKAKAEEEEAVAKAKVIATTQKIAGSVNI